MPAILNTFLNDRQDNTLPVKYELQKLDEIISVSMLPQTFIKQPDKAIFIRKVHALVLAETERIRKLLIQEIINCDNDTRANFYIQQHQLTLTKFADRIFSYLTPGGVNSIHVYPKLKGSIIHYNEILSIVDGLLHFLRNNFSNYYNLNYKIPDKDFAEITGGFGKIIKRTRAILKQFEVDETLIGILCRPLENCLMVYEEINYTRFAFIKQYCITLNSFIDKSDISADDVCKFLLLQNYNCQDFFKYYSDRYLKIPGNSTHAISMAEYYHLHLKEMNQLGQHQGPAYDPTLPGIREQIGSWLTEEIYYLEKKQHFANAHLMSQNVAPAIQNKVHTKLSVGHLSLAVKLLLDTGVIKNKNTSELLRMVASNFRTEKSEHISEDSLRNKVYNIESAAVEGVKDVIVGLLNEVRKY